jgi:transcriptional regulator with XRE-family HTH domain
MRVDSMQDVHWRGGAVYDQSMAITLRTFGARVKWLLDEPAHGDGMTQKELAAALGLSEQFTGALIKGRRNPNVRHLQAIARALNTSVSFLALTTDNPAPDVEEAAPVYFSAQADEAAQLIDAMKDGETRHLALQLVRALAAYVGVEKEIGAPVPSMTESAEELADRVLSRETIPVSRQLEPARRRGA